MVGSMADLPAFAGVLKKAPPDVTQACVTLQKSFRGYADRSAAVVLADLGRCGDADFKLIRKTIERRRPFDLAGPDVDEARAGVPRAPQASSRAGPSKKSPSRKVVSRSQVRGGYRDMKGGMSLESGGHNEAKGMLAAASVSTGTKRTYGNAFAHWAIWRRAVNLPLLLERSDSPGAWEDELCDFYAHVGVTMGYSWDYCHSMLYAIRRVHRLARINLDIRDEAMPLLSMFRKGLKRMRGAPKRKLPVTPKLLLEVYNNGGLDLESWDGALTWFGMLMGFYFLLRSSEYLRKGAEPDEFKCVRWRNVTWARNHSTEDAPQGVPCDEVVLFHEYSKNDFLGQGTDNNTKRNKDRRLCIPTLLNKLRELNPGMFLESNSDNFMLTLSDGKVLPKVVIERLLREAAIRLNQDPRTISSHSLRAGGCTAMYNARYADHEIQRRGRWVSNCWKIYAWSGRRRDNDAANRMTEADSDLMATMDRPAVVEAFDFPI
jgi:integrase